jgi:WD40 repeat protein
MLRLVSRQILFVAALTSAQWYGGVALGQIVDLPGHSNGVVYPPVFSPKGDRLVSNNGKEVIFWDLQSSKPVAKLAHPRVGSKGGRSPTYADLAEDGTVLFAETIPNSRWRAWKWDPAKEDAVELAADRSGTERFWCFLPARKCMLILVSDGVGGDPIGTKTVSYEGKVVKETKWVPAPAAKQATRVYPYLCTISDDKKMICAVTDTGMIIRSMEDGAVSSAIDEPRNFPQRAVFTPDGNTLICRDQDNSRRVEFWDWRKKKLTRDLELPAAFKALDCSPDGRRIAFLCSDRLIIYDTKASEIVAKRELGGAEYYSVRYSPDGKKLAFAGARGSLGLLEVSKIAPK